MKPPSRKQNQLTVFIVGDEPLVAEYSETASAFNYAIIAPEKIKSLASDAKRISIALELSNLDLNSKRKNLTASSDSIFSTRFTR